MASAAKRPNLGATKVAEEETEDTDEEEDAEEGSDSEEIDEEVTVEFEAHSFSPCDFHGVKKLLQQLFLKAPVDVSELAQIIVSNPSIGSVLKQAEIPDDSDDDEDDGKDEVFGFISLLNISDKQPPNCVSQIVHLVSSHAPSAAGRRLSAVLDNPKVSVSLLLSERIINVPPHVALPLHQQLTKEVAAMEGTKSPGATGGGCDYYLLICKTCTSSAAGAGRVGPVEDGLIFMNAEEEFFYEQAEVRFVYAVPSGEADGCLSGRWGRGDAPLHRGRAVALVPTGRMPRVMKALRQHLTQ